MATAQKQLHGVPTTANGGASANQQHPTLLSIPRAWVNRHFDFPQGELMLVAENGSKISLPTPLLGAFIALFVWIAGGTLAGVWAVASMSANVANLSNSQLQYQARSDAEKKGMQDKIDLQQIYITDLREKVIRLESRSPRTQ